MFFIVFRRASLEVIMKDKWMNMGYEEEDLKPYVEPVQDWNDIKRIEILQVIIISREYGEKKNCGKNANSWILN
jgi:hypothetical protein